VKALLGWTVRNKRVYGFLCGTGIALRFWFTVFVLWPLGRPVDHPRLLPGGVMMVV